MLYGHASNRGMEATSTLDVKLKPFQCDPVIIMPRQSIILLGLIFNGYFLAFTSSAYVYRWEEVEEVSLF